MLKREITHVIVSGDHLPLPEETLEKISFFEATVIYAVAQGRETWQMRGFEDAE
jgi:hypothetical protein